MIVLIKLRILLRKEEVVGEQKVLLAVLESFWSVHGLFQMFPCPPHIPPISLADPSTYHPPPPHMSQTKNVFAFINITFSIKFLMVPDKC